MKKRLIIGVIIVIVVLLLAKSFPYSINKSDDVLRIIYLVVLITAVGSGFAYSIRYETIKTFMHNIGIWLLIFIVIIGLYSYKDTILHSRIVSTLLPMHAVKLEDGSLMFSKQIDGAFHIEVVINNKHLNCIVDTGASSIVLSPNNAREVGINLSQLNFNIPIMTANGKGYAAKTIVDFLEIGPLKLTDVIVNVNKTDMDTCLLGMTFLNKLSKVSIEGDSLIITP